MKKLIGYVREKLGADYGYVYIIKYFYGCGRNIFSNYCVYYKFT